MWRRSVLAPAAACAWAQTPHGGWKTIAGGEDLIANGFWNCQPGVRVDAGTLTIGRADISRRPGVRAA